jgi:hypothetical protein
MRKMSAVSMLLLLGVVMLGCNAAKQANPQYVPVPAITGQWTIAFNGGPTVQVNLVSIPCNSISAIAGDQPGISNADAPTASSCSIANLGAPDSGGTAVGSITASGTDGYYPQNLLVAATADSNSTTVMNAWFTECSANSAGECYGNPSGWDSFFGNAILPAPTDNFTGNWSCNNQGSSGGVSTPCNGQQGTYIATQE